MIKCRIIYKSTGDLGKTDFTCDGLFQNKGELALLKFSYNDGESLSNFSFSILKNNIVRLTKSGGLDYTLVFNTIAPYSTNANSYGFNIPIDLTTKKVSIKTSDTSIEISLVYLLNVGGNVSNESVTISANF